ncbi:MAG: hypothetical protein WDW36_007293 [Sanguina aurantia]
MSPPSFSCSDRDLATVSALLGNDSATAAIICSTYDVHGLGGPTNALLAWTVSQLAHTNEALAATKHGLNTSFILASTYQVFMMQIGFALYAAGVVRAKNLVAILIKSFTDTCIAALMFYIIGYGLQVGIRRNDPRPSEGFIGQGDFALYSTQTQNPQHPYELWMWQWSFCAVSTTILSGSIAERATFGSYIIYAFFYTAWTYPVIAHWIWSPTGWLSAYNPEAILGSGAVDYAGSGVVHTVGGIASFVGALFVGARIGRFDNGLSVRAFRGNSPSLYLMGTFLLWFGWYGFNPGSRLGIDTYDSAEVVARTAVTSTLSAGSAALTALLIVYHRTHTWDLLATCTGALAGLVAITSGCSVVEPWAAVICGVVAAPCYVYGEVLMEHLRVDDPVSACPLHSLSGLWGLFFTGLMAKESFLVQVYNKPAGQHLMGIFYGGHGQLLLCQVIAMVIIVAWTVVMMSALFGTMRYFGILRVHIEEEALGMDTALCGAPGGAGMVDFRDAKVPGFGIGMGVWNPPPLSSVMTSDERGPGFVEGQDPNRLSPHNSNEISEHQPYLDGQALSSDPQLTINQDRGFPQMSNSSSMQTPTRNPGAKPCAAPMPRTVLDLAGPPQLQHTSSLAHQNALAQQLQRSHHAQQHHAQQQHHLQQQQQQQQQQHGVQLTTLQSLLSQRSSDTSHANPHSPAACHSPATHQPVSGSPVRHHHHHQQQHPSPGTASLHFPHFSSSMIPHLGSNHLTDSRAGSHQLLSQSRGGSAHGGNYALAALTASSAGRQYPLTYGGAPPCVVAGYMHTPGVQVTHTQDGGVMTHNRQGSGGLSTANSAGNVSTLRDSVSTGLSVARSRAPTNEVIVG